MPLFDYTCRGCAHRFETMVVGRGDDVRCPHCDGADLEKLIGLPAAGRAAEGASATNCRGDGPPCGAPWCGRNP